MDKDNKDTKIAVGLSGGVDSSVAALLLKEYGYDVTGVYLKCYEHDAQGCASDEDRVSAVTTCSQLEIKFAYQNYIREYKESVIDYFFDEYQQGRTPNPDVICNRDIKFGLFLDWAMNNDYDYIATGHYAGIEQDKNDIYRLLKGKDTGKDQSYFLYRLDQNQLAKVLFPLAEMTKEQVRSKAKKAGLKTYNRPDSQGICFIGEVDVRDFLEQRIKPQQGKVLHTSGEVVGTHDGVWFYTIGQRRGFEINRYFGIPLYVVDKNVKKNELMVGFAKDVNKMEFEVKDLHWIMGEEPESLKKNGGYSCEVRIRHLGEIHKTNLTKLDNDRIKVAMKDPSFGVAPGQSAVFYDGEVVLGGGIIT